MTVGRLYGKEKSDIKRSRHQYGCRRWQRRRRFWLYISLLVLLCVATIVSSLVTQMRILLQFYYSLSTENVVATEGDDDDSRSVQLRVGERIYWIHKDWHPRERKDRFPSVETRVKLYMSNWYAPPHCDDDKDTRRQEVQFEFNSDHGESSWSTLNVTLDERNQRSFDTVVAPDTWFLLDDRVMEDCARPPWKHSSFFSWMHRNPTNLVRNRRNMRPYCSDVKDLLDLVQQLDAEAKPNANTTLSQQVHDQQYRTPLLAYFGDGAGYDLPLPLFAKFRSAATIRSTSIAKSHHDDSLGGPNATTTNDACLYPHPHDGRVHVPLASVRHLDKLEPIIWKLESSRHFAPLEKAAQMDTPWERKINRAFWAGDMTGDMLRIVEEEKNEEEDGHHEVHTANLAKCLSNLRCRFVLTYADSKLIDCGLTNHRLSSDIVNGTRIVRKRPVGFKHMQRHKIIISLEGNDVASGLKWSLLSHSIVLMPPPTKTSWAMEELLEAWVHYVPLYENASNAEEMIEWVLTHEQEARRIAERATLFIYDLLYHPDAARDEGQVKAEIARRYRALWH